jgi:hypothetical protein
VVVDLGYRGVDADNPGVQIIHRASTSRSVPMKSACSSVARPLNRPSATPRPTTAWTAAG